MALDGFWWFLMVPDGSCRFLVFFGVFWWFFEVLVGSKWFSVVLLDF